MEENRPSTAGSQLLDRAVAVLRRLGEAGEAGERLSVLAAALDLTPPTAHRILAALERHGLVEQEAATHRYRLGVELFALGTLAADGTGLRRLARPALLRLAGLTGETVFLMVRSGLNNVCVDREAGEYVIQTLTQNVGNPIPLGIGSAGVAILAAMPDAEAAAVLHANAARYAAFNKDAGAIAASLARARAEGRVVTRDWTIEGVSAIAMPVRPPNRDAVAAIAVNMTTARMTPARLEDISALLREEIAGIERALRRG